MPEPSRAVLELAKALHERDGRVADGVMETFSIPVAYEPKKVLWDDLDEEERQALIVDAEKLIAGLLSHAIA